MIEAKSVEVEDFDDSEKRLPYTEDIAKGDEVTPQFCNETTKWEEQEVP